jgi:hypothetical protein
MEWDLGPNSYETEMATEIPFDGVTEMDEPNPT